MLERFSIQLGDSQEAYEKAIAELWKTFGEGLFGSLKMSLAIHLA